MSEFPLARRENPKHRGYPLTTLGYTWKQDVPGVWERHIIRRYEKSGKIEVEALTQVTAGDGGFEVCMQCLGQRLLYEVREFVWIICRDCKLRFRFVATPQIDAA